MSSRVFSVVEKGGWKPDSLYGWFKGEIRI
jgi:hypothetical protein